MSIQIGDLLDGKYRILERLGAGGMGEVYKVEHQFLRTTRVVKVIRPQISESTDAHDRFLREAQLATKVQHPNVATLHDFSALPDGSHYMVWEYIEGENLAQLVRRRGVLPPKEAIQLMVQTLAGLEAIHRAGIIHRDISPENLMITDGNVKIIDLGVAKAEQGGDYAATQTGMFVGKLRYSSPEQLGFLQPGEKIDSRADLYSVGVVLFEMLAGRPPFEATSPHQYYIQHSGGTNVQPIDLAQLPNPLRPVVAKALESDRNRRFANAREFSAALESLPELSAAAAATVRTPTPTQVAPKPRRTNDLQNTIIIAAIALLLAVGVLATWLYRSRPPVVAQKAAVATTRSPVPTATAVELTPPRPQPQQQPQPSVTPPIKPMPEPEREPQPRPEPQQEVSTYLEGTGNDAAVVYAQQQLRGVKSVSLESSDPELTELVRKLGLTIVDDAKVAIHFNSTITHLRFGKKRREGRGHITKNGQTVFRYEMKPQEYRFGDTPAEAFARLLNDVFGK